MKDFYAFASGSPYLTFFLFAVIGECVIKTSVGIAKIIKGR